MTIPAGATRVVAGDGGFENTEYATSGVTLDGGAMTQIGSNVHDGGRHASMWEMRDSDANWPGTGTFDVVISISTSTRSIQGWALCLEDSDDSAASGATTGTGSGSTPSLTVSSATGDLVIGMFSTYSAARSTPPGADTELAWINNTTAQSSLYVFSNAGASSVTFDAAYASSVSWSGIAASFGDGGGSSNTITPPAAGVTVAAQAPTVSTSNSQVIAVPAAPISLSGLVPSALAGNNQLIAPPAASLRIGSDEFGDDFAGTGALSDWTRFNGGSKTAASRVSGKLHHPVDVGDNVSNDTAWFNDGTNYVGQMYYRAVTRPSSGTDYYYFVGLGVGPQSNPDNDLGTGDSHNYSFMAAMCANTLSTGTDVEWEHVSPGLRENGGVRQTIERKCKRDGQSSGQNDVGVLSGTKFNIRLGVPSSGSLTWAYQAEGQDPEVDSWTTMDSGFPTSGGSRMTPASTLYIGFTAYSFDGTITSGEEFTGVIDRVYSSVSAVPTVTVSDNQQVAVPVGSVSVSGEVPTATATANQSADVPAASISVTGQVPTATASDHQTVSVPVGSLTISSLAPVVTVGANQSVSVPAASVTLSAIAPTIAVSDHQAIDVPAASIAVVGQVPSISSSSGQEIAVPAASITVSAQSVTVDNPQTVSVPAASMSFTGPVPSVSVSSVQVVAVPAAGLTIGSGVPVIAQSDNQLIQPPAAGLTITAQIPGIDAPQTISIPAAAIALAGQVPTVVVQSAISVPANRVYAVSAGGTTFVVAGGGTTFTVR